MEDILRRLGLIAGHANILNLAYWVFGAFFGPLGEKTNLVKT